MKLNLPSLLVAVLFASAWHLGATVRYVNANNAAPAAPFTSWATAATNLQAAVDQAVAGDDILVTNGVYRAGGARTEFGEVTNRVAITKALVVRSVNGPFVTFIEGSQTGSAIRGAYVTNGALLAGFTLTNGSARSASSEPYSEDITGGGVWCESASAVVSNCVIVGNTAQDSGGGAQGGTFKGCAFYFNTAPNRGGGALAATLVNCTLTANTAAIGGGTESCTVRNSILYYNQVTMRDANYSGGTVDASCTTPLPDSGSGNLTDDPQLADRFHLSATSPCRGAGNAAFASGRDLDSQPWLSPPSMGCDEYNASLAGPLSVAVQAANTNVAVGFGLELTCVITGSATVNRWDFGDGVILSNRLAVTHSWAAPANYQVVLRAYNSSNPGGISATVAVQVVAQPIHYAARNNPSPVAPYTSWATAATNLQDAVNAATTAGSLVLVTNGVYDTGGRDALDSSNRVAVLTPLLLRSVNGPEATIINGNAAARCVALAAGTTLNGFTLTNGSSGRGGGVYGKSSTALVTNCVLAGNAAYEGGGAYQGTLNNCTLIGNSAGNSGAGAHGANLNNCSLLGNQSSWVGGGAFLSTLNNCTLATNNAFFGGGADSSWLNNCSLVLNTAVGGGGVSSSTLSQCSLGTNSAAWYGGGGARDSLLTACTLTGNSADSGGGAENSRFVRCTLSGNFASDGGGANNSFLTNCFLYGNWSYNNGGGLNACLAYGSAGSGNAATNNGGGAYSSTLLNCTFTGNSATFGGGMHSCDVTNTILYFNFASGQDANFSGGTLNFCCTTPLPSGGSGNLTNAPQLADLAHLSPGSPCRNAGSAAYTVGTDIDTDAWANPPAIGADEFISGSITGALNVAILASYTNVAVGFPVQFIAQINGHASTSRWDFADGAGLTNLAAVAHAWAAPGNYPVVLRAFNNSFPAGISATVTVQVVTQPVHYVARNSSTPLAPFTSWATAATNIQDAVDAVTTVGALVLVTNGVYGTGGGDAASSSNRVVVLAPLTLQSVNGPAVTAIDGGGQARCVYLTDGATLRGLTLTNGLTALDGGGVYCNSSRAGISNCVVTGNLAYNCAGGGYRGTFENCSFMGNTSYSQGGGGYQGRLVGCTLTGNTASSSGGGAYMTTLDNCTLTTNSALFGGGADSSILNSCALNANTALGGGGVNSCTLNQCTLGTNTASNYGGGGARASTLNYCTLRRNRAAGGAGADTSTLNSCAVLENVAGDAGGGVTGGSLNNCWLWGNAATNTGGACASGAVLNNCTLTGNAAGGSGGGAQDCTLNNCLVFYNSALAETNYSGSTLNYSCTTPMPTNGVGNLTSEPKLADPAHLSAGSPCRGTGNATYTSGKDIDGETWTNPADIGCDEFVAGAITGALTAGFRADYTNVAAGYPVSFTALISGHATSNRWDFGDGTNMMNQLFPAHSWELAGDYSVVLRVYNETYPAGISATSVVHVIWQPTHYVSLTSPNPVPPYFAWVNAATNIQQAIDAAYAGGVVLVTNGIYQTGGRVADGSVSNRIVVTRPVKVTSVNGPGTTIIRGVPTNGPGAMRCVYLGGQASLAGFTLTNGATRTDGDGVLDQSGGGLWCASTNIAVSNCVLVANSANNAGGGVYRGQLSNCTLNRNQAGNGGGAQESQLFSCFVASNSATLGGGAYAATLNNCVLSNNLAGLNGGGAYNGMLSNCVIRGNTAQVAGGAFSATVLDSTLVTNVASSYAGGAWGGMFTNCTFTGNSAPAGGGASASTLSRCSMIANTTTGSGGGADGCLLERCTLGFNSAVSYGGGANGSTLYNCIVSSNSAASAGGAYQSGLNNCVLARNTATGFGGGARDSALVNCTVYGNTANSGGGVYVGTVTNSIVQSNVGLGSSNNYCGSIISYSSTMPLPPGPGNFTNAPALGNPATGNYHLQFGSLGINAGYSPAAPPGNDCDNFPRLVGPVDLGAYEYQTPVSQLSYYWLAKYSLPANGTADFIDSDGDGLSNYLEWVMDSNPTNALSKFKLVTITNNPSGGLDVIWQSSSWRTYFLERGTNLADVPLFQPLATGIPGQAGTTTFTDAAATNAGPYIYRVGLQP